MGFIDALKRKGTMKKGNNPSRNSGDLKKIMEEGVKVRESTCKNIKDKEIYGLCLDVLDAMDNERHAISEYYKLGSFVKDKEGKKLFKHIMDEEKEHLKELKEYISTIK